MKKVLLDENMARKLRRVLSGFNTVTVQYMGWAGLQNGALLNAAEEAVFDVLLTGDKTLQYEQNLKERSIAVVSLSAPHWPLVKNHLARIALAIAAASPGSFTRVECGSFVRPHRGEN